MAERKTPGKLVLVSSLAAREPCLSSYAASKRSGEAVLLDVDNAFPWTILRPPAVYGPGDRATLPFFKSIRRGYGAMLGGEAGRILTSFMSTIWQLRSRTSSPPDAPTA